MAIETLTIEVAQEMAFGYTAIGAGLAVGLAGVGTGLGEMGIGAAAVGATAEDREMFGLALLFTVLPETIVIFGLVIALLLLFL
ncbi:MAG: ATPase [Methanocalculaceae archaeon]|jgi:V/A-type H+-transporting ATPase subunit K|nr:ATPase [Methanocalculaceae archaeon]